MTNRAAMALAEAGIVSDAGPVLNALVEFAAQNPGIEPGNYSCSVDYNSERGKVTRDWYRFKKLLGQVCGELGMVPKREDYILRASMRAFSGRIHFEVEHGTDGPISITMSYTIGQYFPTEYRKAACAVLEEALRLYHSEGK